MESWSLFLLIAATLATANSQTSEIFPAFLRLEREVMKEPCDDQSEQDEYDFIIIGAGTAGCVVANRLTEEEDWEVLVLEAGGEEPPVVDIPGVGSTLLTKDIMRQYQTVPSETRMKSFVNQQVDYITGKVVGGCSTVNTMVSIRGDRSAYDNWEKLGNPGWSYDDVLPYFKKVDQVQIPEFRNSKYRSTQGKIKISYPNYRSPLVSNILEAGSEMGYPTVDYNGERLAGTSFTQSTMGNGTRWSSSRGYLHPIRDRKNLHLKKRALVTKILIDENTKTAYGVQYTKQNVSYIVRARKEVILSTGAIISPQLLMVSGVGPREHLEEFGITVIKDSKVGYNAIDHSYFHGLVFIMNQTIGPKSWEMYDNIQNYVDYFTARDGPLTTNWGLNIVHTFLDLENTSFHTPGQPILEGMFLFPTLLDTGFLNTALKDVDDIFLKPIRKLSAYEVPLFPISPKSKGRISLQSDTVDDPPLIDPNVFSNDEDVEVSLLGIRKIIEFTQTEALQKVGSKLYDVPLPTCSDYEFNSDEYWRCALVHLSIPFGHLCGTCKMGPSSDEDAVVDSNLKVHGVNGLRVVDASIFPTSPSPFTQMPTYMVGEKGADLIKADHLHDFF